MKVNDNERKRLTYESGIHMIIVEMDKGGGFAMLTAERQQYILGKLQREKIVKVQVLMQELSASESTIRRDLLTLEKANQLKRIHGGATSLTQLKTEPSVKEKRIVQLAEKKRIATFATNLIEDGDCIYLDAGTTVFQMIELLDRKNITVVTNGWNHLNALLEREIETYLLGGLAKSRTEAIIGYMALKQLQQFRFDKAFLGVNGVHTTSGYSTPDPEEAALKRGALEQSTHTFVLADHSKLHEVTFATIADLPEAVLITSEQDEVRLKEFRSQTTIEVVQS